MPATAPATSPRRERAARARLRVRARARRRPTCRCGRWRRRSSRALACCCSCSAARPSSCRRSWPARARTSSSCCTASAATAIGGDLLAVASELWGWLAAEEHRGLLTLWVEGYARSLIDPDGPWAGFAAATVADWLGGARRASVRRRASGIATLVLAVLRGRAARPARHGRSRAHTAAVNRQLALMRDGR